MKAEDQNMDEHFRKAARESQFSYRTEFWNEVESQLADDSMDNAFRSAAGSLVAYPSFSFEDDMSDAYLDEAFSSAASNYSIEYNVNHWQDYLKKEAILEQDVAFNAAANSVTADYQSVFWSDADVALQNEGLHYEYQTAYWNEAKHMLDRADRSAFFVRWSAVAGLLLLLSIGGIYQTTTSTLSNGELFANENNLSDEQQIFEAAFHSESDLVNSKTDVTFSTGQNNLPVNDLSAEEQNGLHEEVTSDVNQNSNNHIVESSVDGLEQKFALDNETHFNNRTVTLDMNVINDDINTEEIITSSELNNSMNADPLAQEMNTDLAFRFIRNQPETTIMQERLFGPTVEIEKLETRGSHEVSFIANAGVGNRYSKVDFTPALRTSFGFEYMHKRYNRFRNLELGGSITLNHARQNDFGTERRVNVFNEHGGVDKFWYKLQLKDMIYTNVSGVASYAFSKKQNLRLSVGVDYLMFVQSNMSYQIEADKGITTVNNNWGVKDGLNKFDLRIGVGYEYQFSQRIAGQVNGNFGFFDRTDDQFIEKSFFDQEMSVTVGFKYTFLRKS